MTVDEVRERAAEIARAAQSGDDEQAHVLEDDLYERVLRVIANLENQSNSISLCREALTTKALPFARHCA